MADGPKTGRRASAVERACARKWVERYRLAEQSPDGRYCVNPEAPPEEQDFIEANDPELLLQALLGFAEHGTFQAIDPLNVRRLVWWSSYFGHINRMLSCRFTLKGVG